MFKIQEESKFRKFRPIEKPNPKFDELTDLNLWYQHEIPKSEYSYEDALKVFINRLYNYFTIGSNDLNNAVKERKNELEKALESGDKEVIKETYFYKTAKEQLDKLLNDPEVDELIPKEYWDKFSNFYGITPDALHHPHFYIAFENEMRHLEKLQRSDTLLVCHCSAMKPYSKNKNYKKYIECSRETRLFDVCVLSLYPTILYPYDSSNKYPHLCYDWPHLESPGMLYHYEVHNLRMLVNMVRRLNYKRIIILQYGQMKHLNLLKDHYNLSYLNIQDCELYARLHNYKFSNKQMNDDYKVYFGIARQRILGSTTSNLFLQDLFGKQVYPWFPASWNDIPKEILDFVGYPNGKMEPITKYPELEVW